MWQAHCSPLTATLTGALAGLAGTILLSIVSRLVPHSSPSGKPQAKTTSGAGEPGGPAALPSGVLASAQAPGPEGLAEQFAFKLASGLFGRDISRFSYCMGLLVHLCYGSFWGAVLGIVQSSLSLPPLLSGACFGGFVWAIGPAFLVPAMKLMGFPREEPVLHTSLIIAGHLFYGVCVSLVFEYVWRGFE